MDDKFKALGDNKTHIIFKLLKEKAYTEQELLQKNILPDFELIEYLKYLENCGLIIRLKNGGLERFVINDHELSDTINTLIDYCNNYYYDINLNKPYRVNTHYALTNHFFLQREQEFKHEPFNSEISFYESVSEGNLEEVKKLMVPFGEKRFGTISNNKLRNLKYHLVITIAMVARFCIYAGMPMEEAYNLSDIYILKADECKTQEEIEIVHIDVVVDYTKRMREIHTKIICSKPISKCLDYISNNLHKKILLKDIAHYLNITVPYLSKLFKNEIGIGINEYITIKKVEAASNMLRFSDYSSTEISNYFNFSSHSYFIKVFKKYMTMTPKEYKDNYYSSFG